MGRRSNSIKLSSAFYTHLGIHVLCTLMICTNAHVHTHQGMWERIGALHSSGNRSSPKRSTKVRTLVENWNVVHPQPKAFGAL